MDKEQAENELKTMRRSIPREDESDGEWNSGREGNLLVKEKIEGSLNCSSEEISHIFSNNFLLFSTSINNSNLTISAADLNYINLPIYIIYSHWIEGDINIAGRKNSISDSICDTLSIMYLNVELLRGNTPVWNSQSKYFLNNTLMELSQIYSFWRWVRSWDRRRPSSRML